MNVARILPVEEDLRGSVATVEDPSTGRRSQLEYICKMTEERLAADPRRQRTMRALLAFDHPAVPRTRGFTIHRGYLAMRVDDVPNYQGILKFAASGVRPTLENLRAWGIQLATALESAHDAGIFHGTLEFRDILIASSGTAAVIQRLGIAQLRFEQDDFKTLDTMRPVWEPTPRFLPPRFSKSRDMNAFFVLMAQVFRFFGHPIPRVHPVSAP
jgi:hypothetical protein